MRLFSTGRDLATTYWQGTAAALLALVALSLQLTHQTLILHWLLGIGALGLLIAPIANIWRSAQSGRYDVQVLPVLTVFIAVCWHRYWVAMAMVGLLVLSDALLARAQRRGQHKLFADAQALPAAVPVLRGRKTLETSVSSLKPGDKFVLDPAGVVPADATLLEGSAEFDLALLAEDTSLTAEAASFVPSGARLVGTKAVTLRVEQAATGSTHQQIVRFRRHLGVYQTPSVKIAERFALGYSGAVIIIGLADAILSGHASHLIALFAAATVVPLLSALVLVLPGSVWQLGRYGITARSGLIMEQLSDALTCIFDAATLRAGTPRIAAVTTYRPFNRQKLLELVAGFGSTTNYAPLAPVISAVTEHRAKLKHVALHADGLRARWQGRDVLVGERSFLQANDVIFPKNFRTSKTATTIYVAFAGKLAGTITLEEEVRADLQQLLQHLKQSGIRQVGMLGGSPGQWRADFDIQLEAATEGAKLRALEMLQQRPVVYVTASDSLGHHATEVGLLLGAQGETMTRSAANIFSIQSEPSSILPAIVLASRTFRRGWQTMLLGTGVSLILALLALIMHLSPYIGIVGQLVIVFFTVWNSTRRIKL